MSEEIKQAFETLKQAMHEDLDYAWSWHCNLAMPFVDEGGSHEIANKAAVRIMQTMFDIDTSQHRAYQYRDITPEETAALMKSYEELNPSSLETNILPVTDDLGDVEHHPI